MNNENADHSSAQGAADAWNAVRVAARELSNSKGLGPLLTAVDAFGVACAEAARVSRPATWSDDQMIRFGGMLLLGKSLNHLSLAERLGIFREHEEDRGISAPPAPAQDAAATVPLQGGLSNEELLSAWRKKLPGVAPGDQELSAFALGVEVGASLDWIRSQAAFSNPPAPQAAPTAAQPATTVPNGFALVPLIPNAEMNAVMSAGDWQWADLLAAADAITLEQYDSIGQAQPATTAAGAEPEVQSFRSMLLTEFAARWSGSEMVEAGDVMDWLLELPVAPQAERPSVSAGSINVRLNMTPAQAAEVTWQIADAHARGGLPGWPTVGIVGTAPAAEAVEPLTTLTEDEMYTAIEDAARAYKRHQTSGPRGQMLSAADDPQTWIVGAGIKAFYARNHLPLAGNKEGTSTTTPEGS